MDFPPVSKELIDALDKAYPDRAPCLRNTIDEIRDMAGSVAVVRHLKRVFKEQNENVLSNKAITNNVSSLSAKD